MNLDKLGKYGPHVIGAGVLALVLAGVGYMVYASITRYAEEKTGFSQALAERTGLQSRAPFPSDENIRVEQENQRILADKFAGLMDVLGAGQIEVKATKPTEFMRSLEGGRSRLNKQMAAAGVKLPVGFQYGFGKYVQGTPPQEAHVSKLAYQLEVVERLCRMLADARVAELVDVSREVFEGDAVPAGPAGRRPRPGPPPGQPGGAPDSPEDDLLFSKTTYRLKFKAGEQALMTVLNNMASNQLFMCVANFRVVNPKPTKDDIGRGYLSIGEAMEKPVMPTDDDILPREKRLMLGREELTAEMDVLVYRFAAKKPEPEAAQPGDDRNVREPAAPAP